jgi:hypothetical protein
MKLPFKIDNNEIGKALEERGASCWAKTGCWNLSPMDC